MTKKILLIDDNQDIHLMIKYIIKRAGFEMESAYDGDQGLELMEKSSPDLVILDYMMPNKDGPQIFREFITDSKYEKFQHIPFVMLTAKHTNETDINALLELGMAAFLNKPFGKKELINVIRNIFTTHRIKIRKQNLFDAVKNTKDFLNNLVVNIPNALFLINKQGLITFYNGGYQEVLGFGADELLDKPFQELLEKDHVNRTKFIASLDNGDKVINMEVNLISKEGDCLPFSISTSPLKSEKDKREGMVLIGTDISEKKELELMMVEKEKLATLTETVIAVNHEINNPLVPIIGNSQLLLLDEKTDEHTRGQLEAILRNALRIQKITRKLGQIKQPVQKSYLGETKMLDIQQSG